MDVGGLEQRSRRVVADTDQDKRLAAVTASAHGNQHPARRQKYPIRQRMVAVKFVAEKSRDETSSNRLNRFAQYIGTVVITVVISFVFFFAVIPASGWAAGQSDSGDGGLDHDWSQIRIGVEINQTRIARGGTTGTEARVRVGVVGAKDGPKQKGPPKRVFLHLDLHRNLLWVSLPP